MFVDSQAGLYGDSVRPFEAFLGGAGASGVGRFRHWDPFSASEAPLALTVTRSEYAAAHVLVRKNKGGSQYDP